MTKESSRFSSIRLAAAIAVLLVAGCGGAPKELLLPESKLEMKRADMLINEGKRMEFEGENLIDEGKGRIDEGKRLIKRGKRMREQGEERIEQGEEIKEQVMRKEEEARKMRE